MPELPEVETVARQLQPCLVGRTVRRLRILDGRLRNGATPSVAGRGIFLVERSGKRVVIEFGPSARDTKSLWLAVHLRMTGRLIWVEESSRVDRAHLRASFRLDRGRMLFIDTRRFGTFDWYGSREGVDPGAVDPLSDGFTPGGLAELIGDTRQNIKAWLLRQDRLVGLGNIYASEILHAARISPFRDAASLDASELRRLHRWTRSILERAIENCGTTFSDFQGARGVTGSYQQYLAVYGREGGDCPRCKASVLREVQQQRSTFYCGRCQC